MVEAKVSQIKNPGMISRILYCFNGSISMRNRLGTGNQRKLGQSDNDKNDKR